MRKLNCLFFYWKIWKLCSIFVYTR